MLFLFLSPVVIKLCACLSLDPDSYYLQTHKCPFWILYNYQVVLQVWCFCFSIWISSHSNSVCPNFERYRNNFLTTSHVSFLGNSFGSCSKNNCYSDGYVKMAHFISEGAKTQMSLIYAIILSFILSRVWGT